MLTSDREIRGLVGLFPGGKAIMRCLDCGNERIVRLSSIRASVKREKHTGLCRECSYKIRRGRKMSHAPERSKNPYGYIRVWISPDDFFAPMLRKDGRVLEHRLIMARHLGRCLQSWEQVHHKNGEREDNRIENLELTTNGSHQIAHHKGYRDGFQKGLVDGRKEADQEKVQEIFEGIRDIFDELYPPPLPNPEMPLKLWYRIQALKERMGAK